VHGQKRRADLRHALDALGHHIADVVQFKIEEHPLAGRDQPGREWRAAGEGELIADRRSCRTKPRRCAIGSCSDRPSLAGCVTLTGPEEGATASGCRSCCPSSARARWSSTRASWRYRAALHPRRQGAADDRDPRRAEALHERRAVSPLHAHGAVAAGELTGGIPRFRELAGLDARAAYRNGAVGRGQDCFCCA